MLGFNIERFKNDFFKLIVGNISNLVSVLF